MLFNFYISDAPIPPPHIKLVSYADDFTVFSTGTDLKKIENDLSLYLEGLCDFFTNRDLHISTTKCSTTLFTPWTKEFKLKPAVKVNGKVLAVNQHGVTTDSWCHVRSQPYVE